MIEIPENIRKLMPYNPGKPIEELERELGIKDSIKLASNENALGPSPRAIEAISRWLKGMNRYPDGGCFYLKQKLSKKLSVKPKNLIIGNGSNELIELITRLVVRADSEAITSESSFLIYKIAVELMGGTMILVPMKDYKYDLNGILKRITQRTKIVFIANPNNPTGTIVTNEELKYFLENLPKSVVVIIDEAYSEYVEDDRFPNSLEYINGELPVLVLRTFSKAYGLAGLRIGYGVTNTELAEFINKTRQPFNVNSMAQVAALAALDDTEFTKKSYEFNQGGLKYLYSEMDRLGLSYVPSQANFLLINLRKDCDQIYQSLLRKGVIVRPMGAYGFNEHIRVTVGLQGENERFVRALEEVVGLDG